VHAASFRREDLLAAWKPAARIAVAASALAVFPFVAVNVGVIATAEGSILHMAPGEWAIITAVLAVFLWLESALILAVSAYATRNNLWLSTPLALLVFTGIAAWLQPGLWTDFFDPVIHGIGYWVFVTGAVSTICVPLLKWLTTPGVTLG